MHTPALTNFQLFWEKSLDTKLILAWSRSTVVLAFRGTASMANVLADIQVRTFLRLSAFKTFLRYELSCQLPRYSVSLSPFTPLAAL